MKQKDFNQKITQVISQNLIEINDVISQIKDGSRLSALNALKIYQEDYRVRLADALKNSYRGIRAIIGEHDFEIISQDYIRFQPSHSPDLDDYGDQLSHFLESHVLRKNYLFLIELAKFEWSFREIFHREEIHGASALELTKALQDEDTFIQLTTSANVFSYNYLISSLYALKDSEAENISLNFKTSEYIIMYKNESVVKTYSLTKDQHFLMNFIISPISVKSFFLNVPTSMNPKEIQELFEILGRDRLVLL